MKDYLASIRQTLDTSGVVLSAMDYYGCGGTLSSYGVGGTVDELTEQLITQCPLITNYKSFLFL